MRELTLHQLNRLSDKPYFSVKDPVSALTHLVGFIAAIFLTPVLLGKASVDEKSLFEMGALSVFMLSMIVLYGASTCHHSFVLPTRPARVLRKLDHISIFLLIAGSYTPVCVISLAAHNGLRLLLIVYLIMIVGIIFKALWINCPKWVSSIIYIAMGWMVVFNIHNIYLTLGAGFWLLLAGGVFYTIGGVIYALKFSINEDWGCHEIFHIFILLGSLCHYLTMFLFVA